MDSERTANFIADHGLSFGVPVLRNESGGLASPAQPRKYIAEPALSDRNPGFLGKRPTGPDVAGGPLRDPSRTYLNNPGWVVAGAPHFWIRSLATVLDRLPGD